MTNASQIWSDEELVTIGCKFMQSAWMRPVAIIGRLLYSAADFYRWAARPGAASSRDFSCVEPSLREVGPNLLELQITIQPGYEPCREFFLITHGFLMAMPKTLGLDFAQVEMDVSGSNGRYIIQVPPGGGLFAWVRKAYTWLFTARAAAQELQQAYEALQLQYNELEAQISERKRAEAILRKSEEKYRTFINSAGDGIFVSDLQGNIREINIATSKLLGYTRAELIQMNILNLAADPDVTLEQLKLDELQVGKQRIRERQLQCKDGTIIDTEISATRLPDSYILSIVRDVTARKAMELEMSRTREVLASAIASMRDGFALFDHEDRLLLYNEQYREIFPQLSDLIAIGVPFDELVKAATQRGQIDEVVGGAAETYDVHRLNAWHNERIIEFKTSEGRWIEARDTRINGSGRVGIRVDITDRKRAEVMLKDYSEKLELMVDARTRELQNTHERLLRQEKLVTIGQMSASIAHELRNPLGAVKQSAFYLKRLYDRNHLDPTNPKVAEHLSLIESEVDTADRVITNLLNITRMKSPNPEIIDLQSLLLETIKRAGLQQMARLSLNLQPPHLRVWADPAQLQQVFLNLFTNAHQACPENGQIIVSGSILKGQNQTQIVIMDNGRGIAPKAIDKVFEPLYTSKANGTGLGLSICKQIIEAHNGTITLRSQVNRGTTVTILLPHQPISQTS